MFTHLLNCCINIFGREIATRNKRNINL